ncbi:MAG: SRPBCC family protein [Actinomycetota bacterium]|nr:SRPBCC family protein [Actinomycetota bacterium]
MTVRGEGTEIIRGVTPQEVYDFVLDPGQYIKADTKIIWVTKIADTPDGMLGKEDGTFLGKKWLRGSVVTRYVWKPPNSIDVTLVHGFPRSVHAWFEIDEVPEGTRVRHVEELDIGHGIFGLLHDLIAKSWFAESVRQEVREIKRLMEAGERGIGVEGGERPH